MTKFRQYSKKEQEIIESKDWNWRGAGLKTCICGHYQFNHEGGWFRSRTKECKNCTCDKFIWIVEEK